MPSSADSSAPSAAALHVIDRLTFGRTPESLREIESVGVDEFVRRQLAPAGLDDAACEAWVSRFQRLYRPIPELVASNAQWELQNELVGMTVVRALYSRRQLLEVMVDFWSNHLSVNAAKFRVAYFLPTDNATFRRLALGRFEDLLTASARSLSMLSFLDNRTSRADGVLPPNENYARELLEVHTLGDADAHSEADVAAIAHVFTGWTIDTDAWRFTFRGEWNRLGPAADRDTLGWRPPAAAGSIANGESLLRHLAHHPLTAANLALKLCRHFIRDDLSAGDATVQSVARSYLESGTDIRATLTTLFASAAFRDSVGARVKRPNELLFAMLRASGARPRIDDVQRFSRAIKEELVRLDQVSFEAPSPKGYPFENAAWTDAGGLIARWNLAFRVAADRVEEVDIATGHFADGARDVGQFVDRIGRRLLGTPLPASERRHLLAHLDAAPDAPVDARIRLKRAAIVGLTLASPTFQSR